MTRVRLRIDQDRRARIEAVVPGRGDEAIATYRAAREGRAESVTPYETYEAIMTDNAMRYPVNRLLELQSRHTGYRMTLSVMIAS